MDPRFKVVNTTRKGNWVAIELRARTGQVTPAMRTEMRTDREVKQVVPGNNPAKVFVLMNVVAYAHNNTSRDSLVEDLNILAAAA